MEVKQWGCSIHVHVSAVSACRLTQSPDGKDICYRAVAALVGQLGVHKQLRFHGNEDAHACWNRHAYAAGHLSVHEEYPSCLCQQVVCFTKALPLVLYLPEHCDIALLYC